MRKKLSRLLVLSLLALLFPALTSSSAVADSSYNLTKMAMSGSGGIIYVINNGGSIFKSSDSGTTWSAITGPGIQNWSAIATSEDGSVVVAAESTPGDLLVSSDGGATWSVESGAGQHNWTTVVISSDGMKIKAIASDSLYLFESNDGGTTWSQNATLPTVLASGHDSNGCSSNPCHVPSWAALTMSGSGQKIALLVTAPGSYQSGRQLFISQDGGLTWTETDGCCRDQSSYRQIASSRSDTNWTIIMGNYVSAPGYLRYDGSNWQSIGINPHATAGVVNVDTWKGFAIAADGDQAIFTGQYGGWDPSQAGSGLSLFDGSITQGFNAVEQITSQPNYYNDVAISDDGTVRAALDSNTGSIVVSTDSGATYSSHLIFVPSPHISLSPSNLSFVVGIPISSYSIASIGGPVTSYSVAPAMANGLSFDTTTGLISGTPLTAAGDTQYTITATGAGGTSSTTFDVTVTDAFVNPPGLTQISTVQNPYSLTTIAGNTYFGAYTDRDGGQLWVTDGTSNGTSEVGNSEGIGAAWPQVITPWNGGVAFTAPTQNGSAIFVGDGTTAGTSILDLTGAAAQSNGTYLFVFQNRLYFYDTDGYLASTDGTVVGTAETTIRYANLLGATHDLIYYLSDGVLYSYDGTNPPQQITGVSGDAQNAVYIADITQVGSQTLFGGFVGGAWTLFVTDGTASGTHKLDPALAFNQLFNFGAGSNTYFNSFPVHNGFAYFIADGHMWKSDGTLAGTTQLGFSGSGLYGAGIAGAFAGDTLVFSSDLGDGRGSEVQGLDTVTGRIFGISDIAPGAANANPDNFASLNNSVLFTVNNAIWSYTPVASNSINNLVPDPVQQSKIVSILPAVAVTGSSADIVVTGTFKEKISAIQVNGLPLAKGSWTQSSNSVTFTLAPSKPGKLVIQIYNGSVPVLPEQVVSVTSINNLATTTPSVMPVSGSTQTSKPKVKYQECVKGLHLRIVRGITPICPEGFSIKR